METQAQQQEASVIDTRHRINLMESELEDAWKMIKENSPSLPKRRRLEDDTVSSISSRTDSPVSVDRTAERSDVGGSSRRNRARLRCYRCKELGHVAQDCSNESGDKVLSQPLPLSVSKCGIACCQRVADRRVTWNSQLIEIRTIDGVSRACCGVGTVSVLTDGGSHAKVDVLVARQRPLGNDLLLGIDAIRALGGMMITPAEMWNWFLFFLSFFFVLLLLSFCFLSSSVLLFFSLFLFFFSHFLFFLFLSRSHYKNQSFFITKSVCF
ncbi:unnamed protein product [Acanthosepion pharaonis]|uniref:CCHC-type domain-containing protein n=1 Tax=Acanthosepion pharaonis TaxID=158019 RepID=A0A812EJD7_ACAPH|nr:unnamed protein product [Sepia pharaonis]